MNIENFDYTGLLILMFLLIGVFFIAYPRIKFFFKGDIENNELPAVDKVATGNLSDARKLLFIGGCLSILFGISYLFSDEPQSAEGRWGWFFYLIYELAGNWGLFIWFVGLGLIMIIWGVFPKKKF